MHDLDSVLFWKDVCTTAGALDPLPKLSAEGRENFRLFRSHAQPPTSIQTSFIPPAFADAKFQHVQAKLRKEEAKQTGTHVPQTVRTFSGSLL